MTRQRIWPYVLGFIAAVVYSFWAIMQDDGEGATVTDKLADGIWSILNGITKGSRVTNAPYSKTTGVVPGAPADLAAAASLDIEVYSLARVIASEEGLSSTATQAAVGWAVKNHADASGKTLTSLLTYAKLPAHSGSYGTQRNIEKGTVGFNGSDRYASTANDPYQGHVQIATGILDGSIEDLTQGSDQFDRPSGETNPDAVAASRIASGSEEVDLSEFVDGGIRFWKKV
jgi:hypothetical protein